MQIFFFQILLAHVLENSLRLTAAASSSGFRLGSVAPGQTLPLSVFRLTSTYKTERTSGPRDLPTLCQLTDQQLHDVGARVLPNILNPVRHRQEGTPLGDVICEDGPVGTAVVALGDGAEPLLAGCVPNLQLKKQGVGWCGPSAKDRGAHHTHTQSRGPWPQGDQRVRPSEP